MIPQPESLSPFPIGNRFKDKAGTRQRRYLRRLAIALLLSACAGPAFSLTVINEGNSARSSAAELPVDVGVQTGIFAKHGLDVRINYFEGGSKLFQAMIGNSIEIGVSAGPEMALIAKGAPVLAVCNAAPPVSFLGVAVPAGSPIREVADLKGKRIGVASAFSLSEWLARQLAEKQGWGEDGVTPVAIGNAPAALVAAFQTHSVDAIMTSTLFAFELESHHEGRLLIPASQFEGNLAAGTIYATKQFIAADPDAMRRFLVAWFDTIEFMRNNKDETVKIESGVTKQPLAVEAMEYDETIGMFSNSCTFDSESLENLKRSFIDMKLVPSAPNMSELYTTDFMPGR